jgi:hypothetical protein
VTRELRSCNGTYVRDPAEVWRYPWGDPVPGATDMTLSDLMALDPTSAAYELMEQFRPLNAAELRWLAGRRPDFDEVLVRRRGSRPPHAGDLVVGMHAPELHVMAMMTVTDIAKDADVSKATIDSYRYRGYLPEPQVVRGRTPLWARPIVQRWLNTPPGCGWRSDVYGSSTPASKASDASTTSVNGSAPSRVPPEGSPPTVSS